MLPLSSVAALRLIDLPRFARADGAVVVLEAPVVQFAIARVFTVRGPQGAVRGGHAHRACAQLMFCPQGDIEAVCDDGDQKATFRLQSDSSGLLVPPGIWVDLTWHAPDSVLVVLCDRKYEEADYLRSRAVFLGWRRAGGLEGSI